MKWISALRVWVIALGLIVFGSISHADENADANRLFVGALKIITQAETLGISARAKAYAEANGAFTEILEDYTGSDIAVKLATGQSIGSFGYREFLNEFQSIFPCIDLYSNKCVTMIFNYSLRTAETEENGLSRSWALGAIAADQARAGLLDDARQTFTRALKTAALLDTDGFLNRKAGALRDIAADQARAGLWTDALKTAGRIEDAASYKARALRDIAALQVEAGLVDDARKTLENALITAARIKYDSLSVSAISDIAVAQAQAGLLNHALVTFAKAMRLAARLEDADDKVRAFSDIASDQAEAGLLDDALKTAERIEGADHKAWTLGDIAAAQARAGLLDDVLKTLARIGDAGTRAKTLSELAAAQAEAGLVEEAMKTFESALKTAASIEDDSSRAWAFSLAATAQAKARFFDDAFKTAESIESIVGAGYNQQAEAFLDIAVAQTQAGLVDDAHMMFARTLKTAARVEYDASRAWRLHDIAEAQAQTGQVNEALVTAEIIEEAYVKARAFAAIAKSLAKAIAQ